jgi:putative SOS response-associated peptidase YedK
MCGRYATTRSAADLSTLFESYDETDGALSADYNVAPTDPVPVVRSSRSRSMQVLSVARWGLVPAWAKDTRGAARMINARAETVATSSAYARSFAVRRCLVPADGWYEWVRSASGRKQPYFMTSDDGQPLAFAGLWSVWGAPDPIITCSVITTAAVGDLALVHDRMPLLLSPARWAAWLAGGGDPAELLAVPAPEELSRIEIRPVGPAVGDVRNDGPALIERVSAPPLGRPIPESVELTLF